MLGLGIAALAAGMACYAVSFLLFERDNKWNFRAWPPSAFSSYWRESFFPFPASEFWILSCVCAWPAAG
jgi:hypothetical protein